jgi:hypothetical protein
MSAEASFSTLAAWTLSARQPRAAGTGRSAADDHDDAGRDGTDAAAQVRRPFPEAVAHYRDLGPAGQLPTALEDLAVVLAERGEEDEARATLNEAVSLYEGLQARWDIRRAESRLRSQGIRRGVRGPRPQRAAFGWEALTPTEVKIATLVAGATQPRTSPGACSCPGVPCRLISRTSSSSSARHAEQRSSARRCARASLHSRDLRHRVRPAPEPDYWSCRGGLIDTRCAPRQGRRLMPYHSAGEAQGTT